MQLKKIFDEKTISIPARNQRTQLKVLSHNNNETFIVDIDRTGRIEMKSKIQERYLGNNILIRVEINGPPHTNPDGTTTSRDHIHIYREGFGLSWAYDLEGFNTNLFKNLKDFNKTFIDFCKYCNIEVGKNFQMVI